MSDKIHNSFNASGWMRVFQFCIVILFPFLKLNSIAQSLIVSGTYISTS